MAYFSRLRKQVRAAGGGGGGGDVRALFLARSIWVLVLWTGLTRGKYRFRIMSICNSYLRFAMVCIFVVACFSVQRTFYQKVISHVAPLDGLEEGEGAGPPAGKGPFHIPHNSGFSRGRGGGGSRIELYEEDVEYILPLAAAAAAASQ
jgi:hypothetical protein